MEPETTPGAAAAADAGAAPAAGAGGADAGTSGVKLKKRVVSRLAPKHTIGDSSSSEVFCVRFSPDGQLVASGCGDSAIRVYNANTGRLSFNLSAAGKFAKLPVTSIRFRPPTAAHKTRNVLLAAYAEGIIRHWHVTSNKCLHTITEEGNQVYCVDYRHDALKFCSAGKDFKLRVYDESTKQTESVLFGGHDEVTAGHANRVFSLKFNPGDDNVIISGGWDNTVQIWDLRVDHAVRSIFGPHICGDAVDIYKNEILTGSWRPEESLQVWDYGSGKLIRNIEWKQGPDDEPCLLYAAQYSRNNAELIAAGGSGANDAKIFDRKTGDAVGRVSDLHKGVYALDFDPESKHLAVAGGDANIRILQIKSHD